MVYKLKKKKEDNVMEMFCLQLLLIIFTEHYNSLLLDVRYLLIFSGMKWVFKRILAKKKQMMEVRKAHSVAASLYLLRI